MGFLDPKDCEPRDLRAYRQAIESKVLIELETLSYNPCHFVRSRVAARAGLPVNVYERLRRDQWNSVRLNVLLNRCPNAATARQALLLEEQRTLSLLREHRKPYTRQVPWFISKAGAEYYKQHWSTLVRWRALRHPYCPGSKKSTWQPWHQRCRAHALRFLRRFWRKIATQ